MANDFTPFDQVEYMERLERMRFDTCEESFDEKVERIAKAWYESPGPDGDLSLDWGSAHPGDQDSARYNVRFVLRKAGLG